MARPPSPHRDDGSSWGGSHDRERHSSAIHDARDWDRRRPPHPPPPTYPYSSRRSRSPPTRRDRDRDVRSPEARARATSGGGGGGGVSSSTYRSGDHYEDDTEPGQIVPFSRDYPPHRNRSPERFAPPARTSSTSSAYHGPSSSTRPVPRSDLPLPPHPHSTRKVSVDRLPATSTSRSHSPVQRTGVQSPVTSFEPTSGSVAGALEVFTRAMRDTIISHSDRDIAHKHFTALAKFPHTNPTSPHFEEAERRVRQAEKVLHDQMTALEASFNEVLRRTVGKPGVIAEGDVSGLELDGLKERLKRLEDLSPGVTAPLSGGQPNQLPKSSSETGVPPQPSPIIGGADQITTDTSDRVEDGGVQQPTKRGKLRAMLQDIIERLSAVEGEKESLEYRCEELENVISLKESDEAMSRDQGIHTWEELAERRDPERRLARKRKAREEAEENDLRAERGTSMAVAVQAMTASVPTPSSAATTTNAPTNSTGTATPEALPIDPRIAKIITALHKESLGLRQEIAQLKERSSQSLPSTTSMPPDSSAITQQVDQLQSDLLKVTDIVKAIREGQEAEKTVDVPALSTDITSIREQIIRIDKELAAQHEKEVSRALLYSHISTGISDLSNLIQRTRNDHKQLKEEREQAKKNEVSRAQSLDEMKTHFQMLVNDLKVEREQRDADKAASESQVAELRTEIQHLREGMQEMINGREAWTREVMTACLTTVKEEMMEEYAQIAFRELKKIVDKKVAQRAPNASGPSRGASEGVTSASASPTVPPANTLPASAAPLQDETAVSATGPTLAASSAALQDVTVPLNDTTTGQTPDAHASHSSLTSRLEAPIASTPVSQASLASRLDNVSSSLAPQEPSMAARLDHANANTNAPLTHKITLKFPSGANSYPAPVPPTAPSHPLAARLSNPNVSPSGPAGPSARPTLSERMTSNDSASSLRARITPNPTAEEMLLNGGHLPMINQLGQGDQS
ncbi:hypothetical protein IAR55_004250 [Kwoniella newhampshirensis]|uniref:Up-regulated during septation protein 1 domain-containing protein n=1 Tax=Kwoniella newhampshirensis TaxID=1651941 RepID=A0AAW0YMY3_9TREE